MLYRLFLSGGKEETERKTIFFDAYPEDPASRPPVSNDKTKATGGRDSGLLAQVVLMSIITQVMVGLFCPKSFYRLEGSGTISRMNAKDNAYCQ
jgi:hypothetical protein